jgi:F-type H+-transporting ATPase subunit c
LLLDSLKMLGAGTATISIGGSGIGIGIVFAALMLSFAKNPVLQKELFSYAILGFVLTEAIALFGLMMAFLILFAF